MNIKKYYARKLDARYGNSKIAHSIIEDEDKSQRLLCRPTGKYRPDYLKQMPPEYFVKYCDVCEATMAKQVTGVLQHGTKGAAIRLKDHLP